MAGALFAGRAVSYALFAYVAARAALSLANILARTFTTPRLLVLELASLAMLVLVAKVSGGGCSVCILRSAARSPRWWQPTALNDASLHSMSLAGCMARLVRCRTPPEATGVTAFCRHSAPRRRRPTPVQSWPALRIQKLVAPEASGNTARATAGEVG